MLTRKSTEALEFGGHNLVDAAAGDKADAVHRELAVARDHAAFEIGGQLADIRLREEVMSELMADDIGELVAIRDLDKVGIESDLRTSTVATTKGVILVFWFNVDVQDLSGKV